MFKEFSRLAFVCAALAAAPVDGAFAGGPSRPDAGPASRPASSPAKAALDRSGRTRTGVASVYAGKFAGRTTADGTSMNLQDDSAASKTLPLGTTAKVTNLENGKSAVVTIRDRGPHVRGRIVDLSPGTAEKVGIDRHDGVSKVAVAPIAMPPRQAPAARSRSASSPVSR